MVLYLLLLLNARKIYSLICRMHYKCLPSPRLDSWRKGKDVLVMNLSCYGTRMREDPSFLFLKNNLLLVCVFQRVSICSIFTIGHFRKPVCIFSLTWLASCTAYLVGLFDMVY